jgi:nitrite transporter NirC
MTINDTVMYFADAAKAKNTQISLDPLAFILSAMKAGAYVGIGIILIFTIGHTADPAIRPLAMGATFGIALTLVIFAGSDLFTGYTMYGAQALLSKTINAWGYTRLLFATWIGNLLGSILLALLFILAGGGAMLDAAHDGLLHIVVAKKMAASPIELLSRGILCNWLVCLAIWTSARTKSDTAKCILIFWCLMAFIAAGFEHSVANMTVFALALFSEHGSHVTLQGAAYNLFWVTFGNTVAGALVMGWGYWRIGRSAKTVLG